MAREGNIRVRVEVLVDPDRPRFAPARDRIQGGWIATPNRRSQTIRRVVGFLNGFFKGAVLYDRTRWAEVLLAHVRCVVPRVVKNGDREEQTFFTSR